MQSPRDFKQYWIFPFGFLMVFVQSYGHDPDMNSKTKILIGFVPMDMIRHE